MANTNTTNTTTLGSIDDDGNVDDNLDTPKHLQNHNDSLAYLLIDSKRKAQQDSNLDVSTRKKNRTRVASARALALNHEAVLEFVNGKKTFYHKTYKNQIIPYLLPLDMMDLMCYCGQVFSNTSGSSIRKHLSNVPKQCIPINKGSLSSMNEIEYQSKRYDELKSKPEYMFNTEKKRVVL